MLFTKMAHIQPQVRAILRFHTEPVAHALRHVPRNYITTGQFLFVGFGIDHESMQVFIEQVTTIASTTFSNENAAGRQGGRVKLHGLHIAERDHTGIQRLLPRPYLH